MIENTPFNSKRKKRNPLKIKKDTTLTTGLFIDGLIDGKKSIHIKKEYVISRGKFLIYNDPESIHAIDQHWMSDVSAIVPDISKYVRDLTKYGPIKLSLNKVKHLGILQLAKLGFKNILNLKKIFAQDMITILPLLVHLDYLELKKIHPAQLFLHYQMTDLALANNNRSLIASYLNLKKQYPHCELGLMTKNLTLLEKKLREWDLYAPSVLAPFNSKGTGMRTSKIECEALLKNPLRNYIGYTKIVSSRRNEELIYLKKIGLTRAFFSYYRE